VHVLLGTTREEMDTMGRRGFTLIELLVVIAIIAILAAILFPVFARAREKARQASCQSNEKQIALAILMYVQDYDEVLPGTYIYEVPGDVNWLFSFGALVYPYVKNAQLYVCPSGGGATGWAGTNALIPKNSYWSPDQSFCALSNARYALAQLASPADTILFLDTNSTNGGPEFWLGAASTAQDYANYTSGGANGPRHNEGRNYAFADGHVKWYKDTQAAMWTIAAD